MFKLSLFRPQCLFDGVKKFYNLPTLSKALQCIPTYNISIKLSLVHMHSFFFVALPFLAFLTALSSIAHLANKYTETILFLSSDIDIYNNRPDNAIVSVEVDIMIFIQILTYMLFLPFTHAWDTITDIFPNRPLGWGVKWRLLWATKKIANLEVQMSDQNEPWGVDYPPGELLRDVLQNHCSRRYCKAVVPIRSPVMLHDNEWPQESNMTVDIEGRFEKDGFPGTKKDMIAIFDLFFKAMYDPLSTEFLLYKWEDTPRRGNASTKQSNIGESTHLLSFTDIAYCPHLPPSDTTVKKHHQKFITLKSM